MPTTVYFATNRAVSNPDDPENGYSASMIPPLKPDAMTYGIATVENIDIGTNAQGVVTRITDISRGDFSPQAKAQLGASRNSLLIFIHGFDNTFSDAITRAAFNREWMAASGLAGADTTVVAFSWPSLGEIVGPPLPASDYRSDQHMARNSGFALMSFFARLHPILQEARANGAFSTLLAHSMGNLALEAGVESWFLNGNGSGIIFDLAVLAAGDCRYNTFEQPDTAGMTGLMRLASRLAVYYNNSDLVLLLSQFLNAAAKRLGQDGPHNRADQAHFPPDRYLMVDCTDIRDYEVGFMTSHQYYRLSPTVRASIATQMAGPLV